MPVELTIEEIKSSSAASLSALSRMLVDRDITIAVQRKEIDTLRSQVVALTPKKEEKKKKADTSLDKD